MSKYEYIGRKDIITLSIQGNPYVINLSKVDYSCIDTAIALPAKILAMKKRVEGKTPPSRAEYEAFNESLLESEKSIIDAILPGKWTELYKASKEDFSAMYELGNFILGELKAAGVKVRKNT